MIKLPGEVIIEYKDKIIFQIEYEKDRRQKNRISSVDFSELFWNVHYYLVLVRIIKPKVIKKDIYRTQKNDLICFLEKYIEPEVDGLDLLISSVDFKNIVTTTHDGDIYTYL